MGENLWQLGPQEAQTLTNRNATLQEESTNLVDDAGPLTHQALAHTVQRLLAAETIRA